MGWLKVQAKFSGDWVISKRDEEKLPADELLDILEELSLKDIKKKNIGIGEIDVDVYVEMTIAELHNTIADAMIETYPDDKVTHLMELNVTGADSDIEALKEIDNLIGWDSFKELCHEIALVAPQIKKNNTFEAFQFQNYLIAVNDGCGLSTVLDYFYSFLTSLGLFDGKHGVLELELTDSKESETATTPAEALSILDMDDVQGSLVSFDISRFMDRNKYPLLKEFLQSIIELEEDFVFVFRIPFVEEGALRDVYEMLSDLLFVRKLPVLPFNMDQLKAHAKQVLLKHNYTLEDEVYDVFQARIAKEKSAGKFYGLQTVDKVCWEILWLKNKADALSEKQKAESETGNPDETASGDTHANVKVNKTLMDKNEEEPKPLLIKSDEVNDLAPDFTAKEITGFDELKEMVGMEKIADRIKEIVAQVKLTQSNDTMDRPSIHMRFLGSPGTGKTTVARIIGKIFKQEGILRNGNFYEYTARDLVGEYVGQTAPKTASICRDAYGSVLFIDEAYGLYWGDDRGNDFGREALTTLISEMENHRDDMVVIMAGYKEDMEGLMKGNAGLRSRMPFLIEFPSYNGAQLSQIFMQMVKKHFKYDAALESKVSEYFESLPKSYLESKEFANGRFVRNLYERTWSKSALRMQLNSLDEALITAEDFAAACEEKEFSEKLDRKKTIGFQS